MLGEPLLVVVVVLQVVHREATGLLEVGDETGGDVEGPVRYA
jgi:hypothetical protein